MVISLMAYFNSNNRSGSNRSFGGGRGRSDYGRDRDRQMYSAVCDKCGKDCQVPFKPSGDKPIYCRTVLSKTRITKTEVEGRILEIIGGQILAKRMTKITNF